MKLLKNNNKIIFLTLYIFYIFNVILINNINIFICFNGYNFIIIFNENDINIDLNILYDNI